MRTACIEWPGEKDENGYGVTEEGRRAHRVAWEEHYGEELPLVLQVCHLCDNPPCVNPAHLFLATPSANQMDAARKGRKATTPKLTSAQVEEIRYLASRHVPQQTLAAKYGVNQGTISRIATKKTWRW